MTVVAQPPTPRESEASTGRGNPAQLTSVAAEEAYASLESTPRGLSNAEALQRLSQVGPNELTAARRVSWLIRFLANFYQVFALLLWLSAALAFVSASPQLGWAIIVVIVINALFSFYQEFQAERAIAALKSMLPARATVLREGQERTMLVAGAAGAG